MSSDLFSFASIEPPSQCTSMPAILPRSAGAPPNVHHWHARQSTSGLSSSTFDTVFGASIPTLFVLSLIMCVVWRVKRAKRVQRSSRVAPRPVVHAPLGSGFGPVIAGILIGTRAGAAAREHGRLRNSEQVVMSSLACIEEPPRAISRPSQDTETIRLPFRNDRGSRTSLDAAVAQVVAHHDAGHASRVDSDEPADPPPPYSPAPPTYSLTPPA